MQYQSTRYERIKYQFIIKHQRKTYQTSYMNILTSKSKVYLKALVIFCILPMGLSLAQAQTSKSKPQAPSQQKVQTPSNTKSKTTDASGPELSLTQYLSQVTQNNKSYAGSLASI